MQLSTAGRAHMACKTVLAALLILAQVLAPLAGRTPALAFDTADERELGRKFSLIVRARLPIVEDPEIVGYVQALVDRLALHAPPQPWPVSIGVARQSSLNAFAGPAGNMFVFTGLIASLEHESELAAVLAHELAHVTQRHIAQKMEKSTYVGVATLLGTLAGLFLGGQGGQALALGSQAAGQSALLAYSREDEAEADSVGLNFLMAAGYRPAGMIGAFEVLKRKQYLGGGGNIPGYLSTHPALAERIGELDGRIATLPPAVRDRKDDDRTFRRVRTLVRARFMDETLSLAAFPETPEPPAPPPVAKGAKAAPKAAIDEQTCLNRLGRAIALDRANRMTEARQAFESALACAPDDPLMVREAGRHAFSQGDFAKAGPLLQKAIVLNPRDLISLFFYARILADSGQLQKGIEYMERVGRAVPRDAEVHQYLGRMYGQAGRLFDAHLHLSYAAIYSLDLRQARYHLDKARPLARTTADRTRVDEQAARIKEIESL